MHRHSTMLQLHRSISRIHTAGTKAIPFPILSQKMSAHASSSSLAQNLFVSVLNLTVLFYSSGLSQFYSFGFYVYHNPVVHDELVQTNRAPDAHVHAFVHTNFTRSASRILRSISRFASLAHLIARSLAASSASLGSFCTPRR